MPRQHHLRWTACILAALLLPGCQSPRTKAGGDAKPAAKAAATTNAVTATTKSSKKDLDERADALAHYAAGVSYDLRGDSAKATEEFYKSAVANSSNEMLVIEVTRRLFDQHDFEKALTLLTKAGQGPKPSPGVFALQGIAYAELGRNDQAIAADRKAIQLAPNAMAAYRNLASLYLDAKKPQEAMKVITEAEALPGLDAGGMLELFEIFREYASVQAAEADALKPRMTALLDRVAATQPKSPAVLLGMANGYARVGESAKASALFADLMKRFPDFPGLREKLTGAYSSNKDYKKAAELWESVLRENPTDPKAYEQLGEIAVDAKEFDKAVDYYEKLLLLRPDLDQVYYRLGQLQVAARQPAEALETLEKARKKFPPTFQLEYFSARAYSALKQYPKSLERLTAAEVIARVGATNFLDSTFYFELGAAHERNKDYKQAETYFRKSLQLQPDFTEALNYLGYMWAERGENLDEAKSMIEKAIKLEPENGAFLDSMAWVLYKLNKNKEALEWQLKAVIHAEEPDATLYEHLGDIYAALKQFKQAREAWEKSLKIEPNQELQKKLDHLPPAGSIN